MPIHLPPVGGAQKEQIRGGEFSTGFNASNLWVGLKKLPLSFMHALNFFHLLLARYASQPLMIFLKDKCFPFEIIGRQKAFLILVDHSLPPLFEEDPMDDGQRGVVGLLSFCSRHLTSLDLYPTVTKTMTLMKLHNLPLNKTSQTKVIDGLLTQNFVTS